jgi:hypothetical protein
VPFSSNRHFYLPRAAPAGDVADAETLALVRERCRRSEAAWTELADRAARSERLRIEEEARKAAQLAE